VARGALSVRPGITGLWQVRRTRRAGSDFQEWIKYDIEYVENRTWWLDMKIIWKTFETIIRKGTDSNGIAQKSLTTEPRTVRRLMVLLAVRAGAGGDLRGVVLAQREQEDGETGDARQDGMAAYKAGDYRAPWIRSRFYVARATRRTRERSTLTRSPAPASKNPTPQHSSRASPRCHALVSSTPKPRRQTQPARALLAVAYNNEADRPGRQGADEHPDDRPALKAKCAALARLRRTEEALARLAEDQRRRARRTSDQQFLTYKLMALLKRTPADMLAARAEAAEGPPRRPAFMMLLGMAYGTPATSHRAAVAATARRPARDRRRVRRSHGRRARFAAHVQGGPGPARPLRRAPTRPEGHARPGAAAVAERQVPGRHRAAQDLDPRRRRPIRAARVPRHALFETGKREESKQIIDALGKRKGDSESLAWSTALSTRYAAGMDRQGGGGAVSVRAVAYAGQCGDPQFRRRRVTSAWARRKSR
jgi:hypothetical protein